MTYHIALAAAHGGGGFGHIMSILLHRAEKYAKIILIVLTLGLLLWKVSAMWLGILAGLVIGAIALPGLSPKVASTVASINHGNVVGTTGATIGTLAVLGVLLALTAFLAFKS